MEYLPVCPTNLYKYIPFVMEDYAYTFLDDYHTKCDIHVFYLYLNSLEAFQLKNVWNALCDDWSHIKDILSEDRGFKRSNYSKRTLEYMNVRITPDMLNQCLSKFIQDDFLAIIVMRTLLYHGYPRLR